MPVVAHTTARFWLRPVAKAFGTSLSAIATFGFGVFDSAHSRSMTGVEFRCLFGRDDFPVHGKQRDPVGAEELEQQEPTGDDDDEGR